MLIYLIEISLLFLILYFYLKNNTIHFLASLFAIYSFISIYISALYLDLNYVYSSEMCQYIGGGTNAALMLLIYIIIFIYASKLVFTKKRIKRIMYFYSKNLDLHYKIYGVDVCKTVIYLIFIFLFFLLLQILLTPIPLFSNIDRVEYFRKYAPLLYLLFIRILNILAIMLGIMYVYAKNNKHIKKIIIYNIYLSMIILFLAGNKFSTPMRFLLFYILPVSITYINYTYFKKIIVKNVGVLFFSFIIFSLITLQYIHMFFGDRKLTAYLVDRVMISQGQLWWEYYHNYFIFNWKVSNFFYAFDNTFLHPLYNFVGNKFLLFLMDQTICANQLFHRMENGYLYTGAYPAFTVVLLSPIGSLIFHFVLSLLYSIVLYYFFIALAKRWLFTTIFIGYLLVSLLFIFTTSDFGHITTYITKVFILLIAIMIDYILRRRSLYDKYCI